MVRQVAGPSQYDTAAALPGRRIKNLYDVQSSLRSRLPDDIKKKLVAFNAAYSWMRHCSPTDLGTLVDEIASFLPSTTPILAPYPSALSLAPTPSATAAADDSPNQRTSSFCGSRGEDTEKEEKASDVKGNGYDIDSDIDPDASADHCDEDANENEDEEGGSSSS